MRILLLILTLLWSPMALAQTPKIIEVGITPRGVTQADIDAGTFTNYRPTKRADYLGIYFVAENLMEGDQISMHLTSPRGLIVESLVPRLANDKRVLWRFSGKSKVFGRWSRGKYTATAKILRGDDVIAEKIVVRERE